MERTEPVNPERKVNLLLKIWLYPNASAYKIFKISSSTPDRFRAFPIVSILATEVFILYYGFPWVKGFAFHRWVFSLALLHGIPIFFFDKKVIEIAQDYYTYYNKFLYYVFMLFFLAGLVLLAITTYNDIGK